MNSTTKENKEKEKEKDKIKKTESEQKTQEKKNNDDVKEEKKNLLEEEIIKIKEENEKLKEICADYDNQMKHSKTQMMNTIRYANEKLLKDFLVVLDAFEKTIQINKETKEKNKEKEKYENPRLIDLEIIDSELKKILKNQGLEKIKISILRDIFDEKKHDAVLVKKELSHPDNVILEVLRDGYFWQDKDIVLRPSLVVINKISN